MNKLMTTVVVHETKRYESPRRMGPHARSTGRSTPCHWRLHDIRFDGSRIFYPRLWNGTRQQNGTWRRDFTVECQTEPRSNEGRSQKIGSSLRRRLLRHCRAASLTVSRDSQRLTPAGRGAVCSRPLFWIPLRRAWTDTTQRTRGQSPA